MSVFFSLTVLYPLLGDTHLVVMGGGEYLRPTIERFATLAGGKNGTILVVPWASTEGDVAIVRFKAAIDKYMGANAPVLVKVAASREEGQKVPVETVLEQINRATGIFFTGGDQVVLMNALEKNPNWVPALKNRFKQGIVFGGSSAGTALMAENMLTGKGDLTVIGPQAIETKKGLGLVAGVLLDQHFIQRQRQNRIFSLLLRGPECFAIGIDEDNGVYIHNDLRAEVLGPGLVMTFDNCHKTAAFDVSLYEPGEKFQLRR